MSTPVAESVRLLSRHSAVRFLFVGGLSVAVDATTLYILHGMLGLWLPVSTALSFLTSFAINFGLNRTWSFGSPAGVMTQAGRYFALVLVNLATTVVLVSALTWGGMPYLLAKVVTAAGLAVINYFVSKRWIFV